MSDPAPVCSLAQEEKIIPPEEDLTVQDFAGPEENCPETFEVCLSKKGALWVKTLRDNAEAIQVRCHAIADTATEK